MNGLGAATTTMSAGPTARPAVPATPPRLPQPRGQLTERLFAHWLDGVGLAAPTPVTDPLVDDDLQLALYCCYELHYRGFAGVDEELEWDAATLAFRAEVERQFEAALRAEAATSDPAGRAVEELRKLASGGGPSLSAYVRDHGERRHLEEFAIHRSAYQLKEADPHTWGVPRLRGRAKAALVEIQADEYGGGAPGQAHAELFADVLAGLGLDPRYGAYLDVLPGLTLATCNLISMFGLHRRLRGALVGHLAAFEMTSVGPMSRYAAAARRLGCGPEVSRFYDVHVEADEHHGQLAIDGLVEPFVSDEPHLDAEVTFGARALSHVERRLTEHLLDAWTRSTSSLLAEPDRPDANAERAPAPAWRPRAVA
ncbi:MAG: iron-containing redox enzyme family protein [Frankiales bacterium]|nr:iron-containing redox enzyme family protein [Frankiales bacterium]